MSKSPLIKILSYSLIKELYKHHNSVLILEASGSQCICVWVLLSQCKYFTLYWYLSLEMDFFLIPVTRSLKPGTKYSHSSIQKLFLQHLLILFSFINSKIISSAPSTRLVKSSTNVCVCGSLPSCILCNPMDCRSPGSSVHGILQARILEWVAILFSRGASRPGIKLRSPTLWADSLLSEPPGKPTLQIVGAKKKVYWRWYNSLELHFKWFLPLPYRWIISTTSWQTSVSQILFSVIQKETLIIPKK